MPSKIKPVPVIGSGSPGYVVRMQGLRRSGAAGVHQPKATRRARTRAALRRRSIRRELDAS